MVVNESALLKQMQNAYKSGGYHVAVGDLPHPGCFMIAPYGYAWCVIIDRLRVPWSVLGLIVKHIGKIPEKDEAYLVHKDSVQEEVFEVAAKPAQLAEQRSRTVTLSALKHTKLIYADRNVWQRCIDQEIVLVNPEYEDIAVLKEAQAQMVDNLLYAKGQHSKVFIGRVAPGEHEKDMITHLSLVRWQ